MDKYKIAIVIPAFNEGATIFDVVQSVKEYGVVVVVNDASTDNTRQMAISAGAILVNHKENKGYDGALNSGFVKAKELNCDAVITFDADGQHNSKAVVKYIRLLKSGIDLVLGVRPSPARVSEKLFSFYTRIKFGWKDPLCGMKGYSIGLYQGQGYFDSYQSIGTELASFAILNGYTYTQIIIPVSKRQDSSRFSSTFMGQGKILRALVKLIKRKKYI